MKDIINLNERRNGKTKERVLVTPEEYDHLVTLGFDAQNFTIDFN